MGQITKSDEELSEMFSEKVESSREPIRVGTWLYLQESKKRIFVPDLHIMTSGQDYILNAIKQVLSDIRLKTDSDFIVNGDGFVTIFSEKE